MAAVVGLAVWTATGQETVRPTVDPGLSQTPPGSVPSVGGGADLRQALSAYRLSESLRTPPPAPAPTVDDVQVVQQALAAYRIGQMDRAITLSERIASHPTTPNGRAWIIAASAYHARGDHDDAADAYRAFLGICRDAADRQFALRKLTECQQGAASPQVLSAPSQQLTSAQKKELARVADRPCVESSAHFVVESRNSGLNKLLAKQAEHALQRITKVVMRGAEYPHSVHLKVYPTVAEYRANAKSSPEWSGGAFELKVDETGFARRAVHLTQLDDAGELNTVMLDRVLPHELCHLVVTEWFGDAHSPLYLQEGMAMVAEYGDQSQRILRAGQAVAAGKGIPLPALLSTEQYDPRKIELFYAQAYSFVCFMHQRLTPQQFADVLANIKAGLPLRDSLHRCLYLPDSKGFMAQLEQAWQDDAVANAQYLSFLATSPGDTRQ